jgi:hypothetical protein
VTVRGDDLTPHAHRLLELMGCDDGKAGATLCAHCVGRDLTQLMVVDGARLRCAGRTHTVPGPKRVLPSLAAPGLVEAARVLAWCTRQKEVKAAIAARAARRARGLPDPALVGALVVGCRVKRCPSCGAACTKVDGCNQVSCSLCHDSFRWCCMALGSSCTCD